MAKMCLNSQMVQNLVQYTFQHHQGLLLHSIYHRPNGWDHVPAGSPIPRGESSMWGDYHLREAALYVKRLAEDGLYLTFFGPFER